MLKFFFTFLLFFPLINYASFPVSENNLDNKTSVEIVRADENVTKKKDGYLSGLISVLLALLGGLLLIMTIGSAFAGDSITFIYFILSLASFTGGISLGLNNVLKNKKGALVSIFGLLLGLIGIFIILFSL